MEEKMEVLLQKTDIRDLENIDLILKLPGMKYGGCCGKDSKRKVKEVVY